MKKRLIAFRSDHGKPLTIDAMFIEHTRKMLLRLLQFGARPDALDLQQALLNEFGFSCLYSEIGLSKGNLFLPRITILCHQVAGVTRKEHVINYFFSALGHWYRFAGVSKMIGHRILRIPTGFFCLFDDTGKVSPLRISQQGA